MCRTSTRKIECNDKDVLAALSYFCLDHNVNRMRKESRGSVPFLLPTDAVKNKKKKVHAHISYVSTPRAAGKGKGREKGECGKKASLKPSTRKTSVDIRYYKSDEFSALTQEQQDDLQDHRNSNENYKGIWSSKKPGSDKSSKGKGDYLTRAQVYSIHKEHDAVKEKNAASNNEMVAAMK